MTIDIVELVEFYNSPLGEIVNSRLSTLIEDFKKKQSNKSLTGIGYTLPFDPVDLHFIPHHIGVMQNHDNNVKTVLIDDQILPLEDESVDAFVMVHMFEHVQEPRRFLREIWRCLKSNGRILMVIPNRRGFWARFENNPFGHGQPFSKKQIRQVLKDNMFTCTSTGYALSAPPINHAWFAAHVQTLPPVPKILLHKFSGVVVVEAIKQVCAVSLKAKPRIRFLPKVI